MNADPRLARAPAGVARKAAPAVSAAPPAPTILELLLSLEGELRGAETREALGHFMVNETRRVIPGGIACLFAEGRTGGALRAKAMSSLTRIDPHAPGIAGLEGLAARLTNRNELAASAVVSLTPETRVAEFPYAHALLIPLRHRARCHGVLLILRNVAFADRDKVVADRLAGAYGHAWAALADNRFRFLPALRRRRVQLLAAALVLAVMAIPVPMSVLAPAEVVASDPVVVTASLDGVIADIAVEPNRSVEAGTVLVRYNDTDLAGRLAIAERALDLAMARHQRVVQGASQSADLRREIAVTEAERDLARAERDEALATLERTVIRAPSAGIAIFASREDWTGRPVSTGERIMEIGDPQRVEIAIEVGLGDSAVLKPGASVLLFADQDPLSPLAAKLTSAAYRAEAVEGGRFAYRARAELEDAGESPLRRIGVRGTARITEGRVLLGYYLFRRPISQLRQWTGL